MVLQRIIDFTRQIIKGRDQLAANSQKKLDKWRDAIIKEIRIVRKPIGKGITILADLLTKGQFTKDAVKHGHDDLFHLRVDIILENGVCLTLEKNETIEISRSKCKERVKEDLENRVVEIKKPITFGEAYDNMVKGYSSKRALYDYDSLTNNCQRFVDTYLSQNKSAFNYTKEDKDFVKQDISFVLNKYKKLGFGAKVITDLAQRLTLFMTGGASPLKKGNETREVIVKKKDKLLYNKLINKKNLTRAEKETLKQIIQRSAKKIKGDGMKGGVRMSEEEMKRKRDKREERARRREERIKSIKFVDEEEKQLYLRQINNAEPDEIRMITEEHINLSAEERKLKREERKKQKEAERKEKWKKRDEERKKRREEAEERKKRKKKKKPLLKKVFNAIKDHFYITGNGMTLNDMILQNKNRFNY